MKIAIVCGHFIPVLGYLEVHLASALAELGHRVYVVTTDQIPPYVQGLVADVGTDPTGIQVIRLKPWFTLGQVVVANGVSKALQEIQPDGVLVIGVGKRFPKPVFKTPFPIVTLYGDNAFTYRTHSRWSRLKNQFLFKLLKRSTYVSSLKGSKALVAYTPESFAAAARAVGGRWKPMWMAQNKYISLGFWPDEFYFDPEMRLEKRTQMGYERQDMVVITATRLVPEKNLQEVAAWIQSLPARVKWLMVGSSQTDYARSFEREWKAKLGGRVLFMSHVPRANLRDLYAVADLAVYSVPAISVFEALGTGLPVLLPNEPSLRHVAAKSRVGYFEPNALDDWNMQKLQTLLEINRSENATRNADAFHWVNIAKKLLGYF